MSFRDFAKSAAAWFWSGWGKTLVTAAMILIGGWLATSIGWYWAHFGWFGVFVGALLCALLTATALLVLRNLVNPTTTALLPGWPDTIRGMWVEDHSSAGVPSTIIFYLKADIAARTGFGRIIVYAAAGGQRLGDPLPDGKPTMAPYLPHELWFTVVEKKLIRPRGISAGPVDGNFIQYARYFLDGVNCGGETIDEIAKAGNAFSLARKF